MQSRDFTPPKIRIERHISIHTRTRMRDRQKQGKRTLELIIRIAITCARLNENKSRAFGSGLPDLFENQ
jgi:hypothetical protein